jgi:nitric oxide reductase activation protein
VILTQALEVLGDTFAIAGFSGNGRLGVDYFRLKDFDESMDEAVRRRIGAVRAQRNTRMGAAVRHAAVALERVPARVRLLIVLSDGFPNDLDYKRQYAVQDTRRALFELQAKSIYIHAITVNQAADPELDDLYGHIHHSLISDVRQLPDKLVWIYGRLTRT